MVEKNGRGHLAKPLVCCFGKPVEGMPGETHTVLACDQHSKFFLIIFSVLL